MVKSYYLLKNISKFRQPYRETWLENIAWKGENAGN